MSEKMRAELEGAATPPTRQRLMRNGLGLLGIIIPAIALGGLLATGFGDKIYNAMQPGGDPWLAGWVTGALTTFFLILVIISIPRDARRWEIMQPREKRQLNLPSWMRWPLFLADVGLVAAYSGGALSLLLPKDKFYVPSLSLMGLALCLFIIKALLTGLADRKGWAWKQAPAA